MSGTGRRSARDERRRRLGQNFLHRRALADQLVADAGVSAGDLVVEPGAGTGALTAALLAAGARVVAVEADPAWAARLRAHFAGDTRVRVVQCDFVRFRLPTEPHRVVGNIPFGATTAFLRHLLDEPSTELLRADLLVQWEVCRKRTAVPPRTLLSTAWAPWWEFASGRRVPANEFRPVPAVDAGVLVVLRRDPPLLPPWMARPYHDLVRREWRA